ncbi:DUF4198 domain-containing protein [Campylobacter sp. 7477a]|uniref:DUF4198 domain-containing protein n=1 Tax=Campylobacter sp. 7477a TaxID=2735741 RepID=UPI0030141E60|nr:DUF4198 domain-containing protein [Campylobacter sp. 7477a]
MQLSKAVSILLSGGLFCSVLAHDFWVSGTNEDKFNAHIGYGHDFPKPEAIPENRVKLFNPLYIVKSDGEKSELKQNGANYEFQGSKLANGSYVLAGDYKPTFWTKDSEGKWHMDGTKDNVKNSAFCELAVMNAKQIVIVGDKKDEFIHKTIGQTIEIVPLDDPRDIKVDKPFKVQVFLEGKPLKTGKVTGTFDGFLQDKHAFSGTTDLKGIIEIVALRPGKWLLEATHERDYKDQNKCDEEILLATLTLEVKDK